MVQRRAPDPAPAGQDRDAHRDSVPAAQPVPRPEPTATAPAAAVLAPFGQAARQQRVAPADVDRIADRVYGLLVRRVRGERERRGF